MKNIIYAAICLIVITSTSVNANNNFSSLIGSEYEISYDFHINGSQGTLYFDNDTDLFEIVIQNKTDKNYYSSSVKIQENWYRNSKFDETTTFNKSGCSAERGRFDNTMALWVVAADAGASQATLDFLQNAVWAAFGDYWACQIF